MSDFDPELFGTEVGNIIAEVIEEKVITRLKELEAKTAGMQSRLDKCMAYAGDFQEALDYAPGTLVRRNGQLLVSVRQIKSGGNTRDGSGWERVL